MPANLNISKKGAIFRSLASNSYIDAGLEHNLDKHYANRNSIRNAVYRVYQEVLVEPGKFGISDEIVDLVKDGLKARSINKGKKATPAENDAAAIKEDMSPVNSGDIKAIVTGGRNKAAMLIDKKMDILLKSPKKLDAEKISSLATVFGIFFDKAQIVQGEATENIAVLAKNIDENMTSEEAMESLLKFREKTMEDKYDDK